MIWILYIIGGWLIGSLFLFTTTFILYLAVMKIKQDQKIILTKHWTVRWMCFWIVWAGLQFDTALNWFTLSVAFLEFPKEFLSTARVIRHKWYSTGWRQSQAFWWCYNWLTPFDPNHCDKRD